MTDDIIIYQPKKGHPVRVFRPWEIRKLIDHIPKVEYQYKFEALLYTAGRYREIQWLYKHPARLRGNSVHMKNAKAMVNEAYRYIHLNGQGMRAVKEFLGCKTNLPTYQAWGQNLKRWCELAGIPSDHACAKSTRKTFESWLIVTLPQRSLEVLVSVGHDDNTALRHYLTFPYTDADREEMKTYVEGW